MGDNGAQSVLTSLQLNSTTRKQVQQNFTFVPLLTRTHFSLIWLPMILTFYMVKRTHWPLCLCNSLHVVVFFLTGCEPNIFLQSNRVCSFEFDAQQAFQRTLWIIWSPMGEKHYKETGSPHGAWMLLQSDVFSDSLMNVIVFSCLSTFSFHLFKASSNWL